MMGIAIDPKLPARDWGGIGEPSLKTVGHLLSLSFSDAAESGFETFRKFRTKSETLEQRVWTLWRESVALALPEFFVTAALTRRPDDGELGRLLVDILEESEAVAKAGSEGLTAVHFRTPTSFPLYPPLRAKLPVWARTVAPEHLRDDGQLRERLDRAFERGFRRAFADRSDHFQPLRDFFAGEAGETGNRRDAWQRYYDGLTRAIEEKPLFNQPEEGGATLGAIFQPLRCYWRERPRRARRDRDEGPDRREIVHVDWLQGALERWLEERRSNDALRVVTGGPGSGKSSSALWFARDVGFAGSVNVFVVQLQGLSVDRPIDAVVQEFIDLAGSDHGMLETSPLHWLRDDPKPLLLIFDGLDEVARPDGEGLEVTKTFLRTLHSHLGQANREAKARLMALALGRPQAAEEAALAMGGLEDEALLHVARLSPLDYGVFLKAGDRWNIGIEDHHKLANEDFRTTFYERYRPFEASCNGGGTPEALTDDDLAELTVEPLLLYLLIISGYAGADWKLAKDNRNRIYQQIFHDIHKRDLMKPGGHSSKMGIEKEEDFLALMECLGLAAWLGGGRSGSDEDFATIRDQVYLPECAFGELPSARLDNVALQTFTHRSDREHPGYAFIHKSFGEYLTARALIKAGEKWCGERPPSRLNRFAEDWLQLTGGARLTSDILRFMVDESRLRTSEQEAARRRVSALAKIASHTLAHGFPAHGELITYKGTVDWRRREIFQRNAEEALYGLIHAWGDVGYPFVAKDDGSIERDWEAGPIKVEWLTPRAATDMLTRVRDQWSDDSLFRIIFQRWDFTDSDLGLVNLKNMWLCGSKLCRVQTGGLFTYSRNGKVSSSGGDLDGANLSSADLRDADLYGAYMSQVNLQDADLQDAGLAGTYMGHANLCGANLRAAELRYTYLGDADLSRANLMNAKLEGADLNSADCEAMNLESARLDSADLSNAINLTQQQINAALGNLKTKLSKDLKRPAHWSDED